MVVVANLKTKEVKMFDYAEIVGKQFNTDNYLLSIVDRSGNVYSIVLKCSNDEVTNLTNAINSVKNQNVKIYEYILNYGVSTINSIYSASDN